MWELAKTTQRLHCSSFLAMTYFLLREYDILPKEELPLQKGTTFEPLGTIPKPGAEAQK